MRKILVALLVLCSAQQRPSMGSVVTVAPQPGAPGVALAGGTKLYRTTDAGRTWQPVEFESADANRPPIWCIEFAPSQPQTVYMATRSNTAGINKPGGLWNSTDGGLTWRRVSEFAIDEPLDAMAVDPSDPNTIYIGVRGRVDKSTDSGRTIRKGPHLPVPSSFSNIDVGLGGIENIAIDPRHPSTVYVGTGKVGPYRSDDGGAHWSRTQQAAGTGAKFVAIDPDTSTVYLAQWDQPLRSWNGANWSEVSPVLSNAHLVVVTKRGLVATAGSTRVMYLPRGGSEWIDLAPKQRFSQISQIAASDDGARVYVKQRGVDLVVLDAPVSR